MGREKDVQGMEAAASRPNHISCAYSNRPPAGRAIAAGKIKAKHSPLTDALHGTEKDERETARNQDSVRDRDEPLGTRHGPRAASFRRGPHGRGVDSSVYTCTL